MESFINTILKGDKLTVVKVEPLEGNDHSPELTLGDQHTAKEVFRCHCGQEHINVGLQLNLNYVRCYNCKQELPDTTHWCHPSRFTINS